MPFTNLFLKISKCFRHNLNIAQILKMLNYGALLHQISNQPRHILFYPSQIQFYFLKNFILLFIVKEKSKDDVRFFQLSDREQFRCSEITADFELILTFPYLQFIAIGI